MSTEVHYQRNISLLWAAQFISKIGDQLFAVAGGFLVMLLANPESGEAPFELGMFEMVHALPALLVGPILGVYVDRCRRRNVMIVTDFARALLLFAIPVLLSQGVLEWWGLCVLAFGVFSFTSAFAPARDALVPVLAGDRNLTKVNVLFQSSLPVAVLLGAGLYVVVPVDKASPMQTLQTLIIADGVTFLVSAGLLLAMRISEAKIARAKNAPSVWRDTGESLSYALKEGRLFALLVTTAVSNFFIMGPAIVGAMLLAKISLGLEAHEAPRFYGAFEASMLVGVLAGMFWVWNWGAKMARGKVLIWGLLLDGLTYMPFIFFKDQNMPHWVYFATVGFHGFFIPWIWIIRTSIVQSYYPKERLGRIFALIALTVTGFHALSAGATGWLGEHVDAHWLFFWGGLGGLISGLVGLSSRELRNTV